jgi:HAD superfamily hydrolase (TIGR01509 family)
MNLAAVIFDMDGLMLDTEAMMKPCFQQAASDIGCEVDDEFYRTLIGRNASDSCAALTEKFGLAFRPEELQQRIHVLWRQRVAATGIPTKAGLGDLLALLERQKTPKAVATSTDTDDATFCLRATDLWDRFEVVVCGDQVQKGKPAPDIYLHAARLLRVDPAHCVALEDSNAGVLAASSAGMRTLMIPESSYSPSPEALARAYRVVPSLHVAKDLIESWLPSKRGTRE